jgi:hypothetical protein
MKVKPKDLLFSSLPSAKQKKKLMKAQSGKRLGETGTYPIDLNTLQSDYFDNLNNILPTRVQDPVDLTPTPDTSKIKLPEPNINRVPGMPPPKERRPGPNIGNAVMLGAAAFDALLPEDFNKQTVVQPQMGYNPYLYGTGSQAIAEYGGYIKDDGNTPSAQSGRRVNPRYQVAPVQGVMQIGFEDHGTDNKPIITHNPNDPRIQRYADSMTLHNAGMRAVPRYMKARYAENFAQDDTPAIAAAVRRLGPQQPVFAPRRNLPYSASDASSQEIGINIYDKPHQPYVYVPLDRDIDATQVQGTDMTTRNAVQGTGLRPADLSQRPTKYSVTVRDENAPSKQRSIYFKDKKEWRNFVDSGAVNFINTSETQDSATGAGYPTMRSGGWIQKAINPEHKGYCTPMTKSTCTPRRKALAKTLKKMAKKRKKADGGVIPDNMSVFNPHRYEHGGNVNGGANIHMVSGKYPNTDLLEQWLLYKSGGSVNGDAHIREVGPNYPNADLMEQWLLYKQGGQVNWDGKEFREVGPRYPNTDLFEQWIKYEGGGPINNTGYLDGSATANNPYNIIPGGDISMQGVSQPIMARPIQGGSLGEEMMMMPGQDYAFNADGVMEYPLRAGGQLSAAKAKEMLRDGTANGKKLTKKQKQYFGMVAAGKAQTGMQVNNTTPAPQVSAQEKYYQASARLGHYKNILNERLKAKNPQAFKDYFSGLTGLRRAGDATGAEKYVQESPYEDYLSPEEVQSTLSPEDYNEYLTSLQDVNAYNVQQGRQPLFGTKEGPGDIRALNYGRRFASLQLTPSVGVSNTEGTRRYGRQYNYDPATRQVSFTEEGDLGLRPSYLGAPPAPMSGATASLKAGGVMYDDGGQVQTMWGGDSQLASYNPYDGGTIEFEGASHDNGGIGMHFNGQPVEVEGGEFASRDQQGNLNIYGNMVLPGTKTKFKSIAKEIADKERNYDKLRTTGSELVNEANPANRYERLAFNAGTVMMMGGKIGQQDLAQKKERLSALQKAMLDTADEFGLDPEHLSRGVKKKARKGAKIYAQAGAAVNDPTMADRNNNPGNIKWGKFAKKMGAKKGPPADDGGNFAIFPNREAGDKAMRTLLKSPTYKDLPIDKAIEKWTGQHPYKYDLSALGNAKVSSLSPDEFELMVSTMKQGEGTRYGPGAANPPASPPVTPTFTPYGLPNVPGFTPPGQKPAPNNPNPPADQLNPPPDRGPIPSDVEALHMNQVLGEIYGAATNHVEPVPAQRYEPQLFTPYQVSFQDRRNLNQSSFSALQRSLGTTNPAALGALAAQKYQADNAVNAEEFRTNQAISNEVTNKNVSLLNDAELKNLAIADQQMVRQSTARSKTRQMNQMILNSLSSKYAQNQYENKRLAAYENLYDYRFVPQKDGGLKATHYGPNALFNFSGKSTNNGTDVRTVTRYDQYGNVKGVTEYDDYDLREMQREIDVEMKKRKLPLLTAPKLE